MSPLFGLSRGLRFQIVEEELLGESFVWMDRLRPIRGEELGVVGGFGARESNEDIGQPLGRVDVVDFACCHA